MKKKLVAILLITISIFTVTPLKQKRLYAYQKFAKN